MYEYSKELQGPGHRQASPNRLQGKDRRRRNQVRSQEGRNTIEPLFTSGTTQYLRRRPLAILITQAKQDFYRQFCTDSESVAETLTKEYRITFA